MRKTFIYEQSEITYTVSGSGQPVVLLHGFAEDGSIWSKQQEALQKLCRLIIPDLPGSGKSEILQNSHAGMEDYAQCICALLDHEQVDQCILLGHSMGGYITLAFAEMFPGRLNGFGFVHSTAFTDNEEKKAGRKKGIGLIEQYGVFPFIKNTTPNLFADAFKKQQPEKVTDLIEKGRAFSTAALVQYYTAMMNRPDRTDTLRKTKVPVLFIIGTEDTAAPPKDLLQQVHLPKVSHIHIIEGVAHMSLWEAPEELNDHLVAFIKDIETA